MSWNVTSSLGLIFLILGLQIFFQINKVGGGKKIKIKLLKTFFLFNLKHIWIGKKNCMILHCKNAEMTIILSFLHFYSVKSYNFLSFFNILSSFLNLAVFYIGENKKSQKKLFFFF